MTIPSRLNPGYMLSCDVTLSGYYAGSKLKVEVMPKRTHFFASPDLKGIKEWCKGTCSSPK